MFKNVDKKIKISNITRLPKQDISILHPCCKVVGQDRRMIRLIESNAK
jgi:hypothetical protein